MQLEVNSSVSCMCFYLSFPLTPPLNQLAIADRLKNVESVMSF